MTSGEQLQFFSGDLKQPALVDLSASSERASIEIRAPRGFFLGPVFASVPQLSGRGPIKSGDWFYTVGGFHPDAVPAERIAPALYVKHAQALFTLLSFLPRETIYQQLPADRLLTTDQLRISFSMNAFCLRYAASHGGKLKKDISALLGDLTDTWIRMENKKAGERLTFRLLESRRIYQKFRPVSAEEELQQLEFHYNHAVLSEEFFRMLCRIDELFRLRLSVFNSISSRLAQSLYLYLPSRAVHHGKDDPWRISLAQALTDVSHPVAKHRSKRMQLFCQNQRSVVSQLDGAEIMSGVLRVRIVPGKDDGILECWTDKPDYRPTPQIRKSGSVLFRTWLETGGTEEGYIFRLKNSRPLDTYEMELLLRAGISVEQSEQFYTMIKALVGGSRFHELLHEIKVDVQLGKKFQKSQAHLLGARCMEAVRDAKKV